MKGNEEIIDRLNARLAEELSAISQYMVQSEMCANWGYQRLHDAMEKRAVDEMKHAEKLIGRIIFLEGTPAVGKLSDIRIGSDIRVQHENDRSSEQDAIRAYNEDIKFAAEASDNGTRKMLESILEDEEQHLDWIEAQLDQINQIGLENYLSEQLG